MDTTTRIERALLAAIATHEVPGAPPKLAAAIRHAVFPGGARIRPHLCLAVARACGDDDPALADATGWSDAQMQSLPLPDGVVPQDVLDAEAALAKFPSRVGPSWQFEQHLAQFMRVRWRP